MFNFEQYIQENLENVNKTSSGQITCKCPSCGRDNKFYINPKNGNYVCFRSSCDFKGLNLVGVVSIVECISWYEARKKIFNEEEEIKRENIDELISFMTQQEKTQKLNKVSLPKEFVPVYNKGKFRYPKYLAERNIKKETAKIFNLGYCNYGFYANRIIIPIECPGGYSFTTRDITGNTKKKYLNPKESKHNQLLFGWDVINTNGDFTIVEGPFDAIKMWQHGLPSLALFGKVLHKEQMKMLRKLSDNNAITVMLDPEELNAPYKVAKQLLEHFKNVFIAALPKGIDPGLSKKRQAKKAYNNAFRYVGQRNLELSAIVNNYLKKS